MNDDEKLAGTLGFIWWTIGLFLAASAAGEWPANNAYVALLFGAVAMTAGAAMLIYAAVDA
jgi:hypothetical protein